MGAEDLWSQLLAKHGVQRRRNPRDIHVDSSALAAEIAVGSDRIALIQDRLAKSYVQTGRLAEIPGFILTPQQGLYVLLAETSERRKPEAIVFRDWLLAEYAAGS